MTYTDKNALKADIQSKYEDYKSLLSSASHEVLEMPFAPLPASTKCATFAQGENLRDLLTHAWEWQRLQVAFVENIRNGNPKDFIPDPYRKDYKEMDRVNWEKHQQTSLDEAIAMLDKSHQEMLALVDTFTDEELFNKKVFKVTYTTTMGAYFMSVTISPYTQIVKRLKPHIKKNSKKV